MSDSGGICDPPLGPVRVGIVVQHHPSRAALLDRLLPRLPKAARVVVDPDPGSTFLSAWRTYEACLRSRRAAETHLLVIQDDAWPCASFGPVLRAAVRAQRDRVIVACVCGNAQRNCRRMHLAAENGMPFAELDANEWCPTVATCYPQPILDRFIRWIDEQEWPPYQVADDAPVGRFLNETGLGALMTVPSLVEHPDDVESLVAPGQAWGGTEAHRLACCYVGDCDARTIDWTRTG